MKQIVGGTLTQDGVSLRTNFVSDRGAAWYADLYRRDGLSGGHVIKLGPGNDHVAREALAAWPGGLQVGGGMTPENAEEWISSGASHVIVTSCLFDAEGTLRMDRLKDLVFAVGAERLVLDLSCRRVQGGGAVAMNRWQTLTELRVTAETLDVLAAQAYEDGKISRQDTLWSMEEKKVWSYLGQDGFHEIEVCEKPVLLKPEDKVLLMSKGIFEELSWREIEDILIDTDDSQKSADCLIRAAERKGNPQRDNGSVILIQRLEA